MPTVPRQQGREVLAEPMPGPRNTVSATEETFGGGAANKQVVAAAEQLNTTLQNKIARENAQNQLMASNVASADDKNAMLKSAYDPTLIKVEYEEGGVKKTKEIPRGFMLRQRKDASINGGAMGPDAIGTTDQVVAARSAGISDPTASFNYNQRMATWKQALDIKFIEHENSQKKLADEDDRISSLDQTANDPIMPLEIKIAEGKRIQTQFSVGQPQSKIDADLEEHAFKSVQSELNEILNSRVADEKEVERLIKDAGDKYGVNAGHINQLNGMVATDKAKKVYAYGAKKIETEEAIVTTPLSIENEWKLPWVKQETPKQVKKIMKGGSTENAFNEQVMIANKNSAKAPFVTTDNESYTDLMLKMVAPGYADEKKRLDHITAYASLKVHPDDYNILGQLYKMDPEKKDFASQGLKGLNDYVNREEKGYPDIKRTLMDGFLKRMEKKKPDERVEDVVDDTLDAYNKKTGKYPANTKKEDAPNATASVQQGKAVQFQNTGMTSTPKKKPDATLTPPNKKDEYEYKTIGGKTYRKLKVNA